MSVFATNSVYAPTWIPEEPEARSGKKHQDNAPLVTIIGAGIAGLTAAHELMERGFEVQVVEAEASRERPGEVAVGGMARTQWGRIKAEINDLHPELSGDEPWKLLLRRIIQYTRSPFVETEPALDADITFAFEAGLPNLHYKTLKAARALVRRYKSVNEKGARALRNRLEKLNEPAVALLTGSKLLQDTVWRDDDAKRPLRNGVIKWEKELAKFKRDKNTEAWAKGSLDAEISAIHSGFDSYIPGELETPRDRVDAALTKALLIRLMRLLFNLSPFREETRKTVGEVFERVRCKPGDSPRYTALLAALAYTDKPADRGTLQELLDAELQALESNNDGEKTDPDPLSTHTHKDKPAEVPVSTTQTENKREQYAGPFLTREDFDDLVVSVQALWEPRADNSGAKWDHDTAKAQDDPVAIFLTDVVAKIATALEKGNEKANADLLRNSKYTKQVVRVLRREVLALEIHGHASSEGDIDTNKAVAAQRAVVARDILSRAPGYKLWGPHVRIVTRGEEDPVATNATWEGRSTNRRATLVIVERLVPGEHGFRFFPRHYKNLFALMKRIPLLDREGFETHFNVHSNLVTTTRQALGMWDPEDCADKNEAKNKKYAIDECDPTPINEDLPRPRKHDYEVSLLREMPRSLRALHDAMREFLGGTGATLADVKKFQLRAFRFLTSGSLRRWNEYEDLPWSKFIGLERCEDSDNPDNCVPPGWTYTDAMKTQLRAAAQALLAYAVHEADTHSYGNFSMQTIVDQLDPDRRVDLILNGPTSLAWLEPWKGWLRTQGVRFFHAKLHRVHEVGDEYLPVFEDEPKPERGEPEKYLGQYFRKREDEDGNEIEPGLEGTKDEASQSDFYVVAIPISAYQEKFLPSAATGGVHRDLNKSAAFYEKIDEDNALRTMSGLQFHFETAVRWGDAHVYYPESWWGLSTITQTTRWRIRPRRRGGFLGVVSVDISDWTAGDPPGRPVPAGRTPVSLAAGVHKQIEWGNEGILRQQNGTSRSDLPVPDFFHIDARLPRKDDSLLLPTTPVEEKPEYLANLSGHFVHRPGLCETNHYSKVREWKQYRLDYDLTAGRWAVAGAHMATFTRMMTMEGSSESGMHATNAILERLNSPDKKDKYKYNGSRPDQPIQPTKPKNLEDDEVPDLEFLKELDDRLFKANLPHFLTLLEADRLLLAHEKLMEAVSLGIEAGTDIREVYANRDEMPERFKKLMDEVCELVDEHLAPLDQTGVAGTLAKGSRQFRSILGDLRDLIFGRESEPVVDQFRGLLDSTDALTSLRHEPEKLKSLAAAIETLVSVATNGGGDANQEQGSS